MADLDEATRLLSGSAPLRWLFTGDSITHGAAHTNGARDYVQLFEERVRWELRRTRDHVIRTAISGRTVRDLLADAEWSVSQYRAHVVSLMFGMNDANTDAPDATGFADDLARAVVLARDAGALAVIVHTPNRIAPTETAARRTNLPHYADAVRHVAAETDAVLVDHAAAWAAAEEAGAVERWIGHGCHPNAAGHRVLYRELAGTLGIWEPTSLTGRGDIPAAEPVGGFPVPEVPVGRPESDRASDDGAPRSRAATEPGRI